MSVKTKMGEVIFRKDVHNGEILTVFPCEATASPYYDLSYTGNLSGGGIMEIEYFNKFTLPMTIDEYKDEWKRLASLMNDWANDDEFFILVPVEKLTTRMLFKRIDDFNRFFGRD